MGLLHERKEQATGEHQREDMRTAQEKERHLRDRCKNTLHVSGAVLANFDVQFDAQAAVFLSKPQVSLHRHWSHFLKSTDGALDLARECATG